jgi:pimeloyl-ACP methyl ester carboxylesterase
MTLMSAGGHALRMAREMTGLPPRAVTTLRASGEGNALSVNGMRQLGEVALDEVVVTGMTLMAPPPAIHTSPDVYAGVADELTALGAEGAYTEPEPLQVKAIRRRRIGPLAFEQLTYEHDPGLPGCLSVAEVTGPATAVCNIVRHADGPRPWLVWVHGAGMGGPTDFALARIGHIHRALGFNVVMPIQPGHGVRRNAFPVYPDTDPLINVAGMMRTVSEVRAVIRWLEPQATGIALAGLSLGSAVAALVAGMEDGVDAVAVYTPITGLNGMIANHLHRWGPTADEVAAVLGSDVVTRLTSLIDPLAVQPLPPVEHRLIVGARHDQMAMRAPALALYERWGGELYWHDGGHVGHLFSGDVTAVTDTFLRKLG